MRQAHRLVAAIARQDGCRGAGDAKRQEKVYWTIVNGVKVYLLPTGYCMYRA